MLMPMPHEPGDLLFTCCHPGGQPLHLFQAYSLCIAASSSPEPPTHPNPRRPLSIRYTYSETLGRWGTADLLIGLTYLCRKNPPEHVTTDIARAGQPYGRSADTAATAASLRELREIRRVFQYCVGMRERRPGPQREYFATALGIGPEAILAQETRAGVLKPSFILARDDHLRAIVLIIRGTHSFKDMFTSLTGAVTGVWVGG